VIDDLGLADHLIIQVSIDYDSHDDMWPRCRHHIRPGQKIPPGGCLVFITTGSRPIRRTPLQVIAEKFQERSATVTRIPAWTALPLVRSATVLVVLMSMALMRMAARLAVPRVWLPVTGLMALMLMALILMAMASVVLMTVMLMSVVTVVLMTVMTVVLMTVMTVVLMTVMVVMVLHAGEERRGEPERESTTFGTGGVARQAEREHDRRRAKDERVAHKVSPRKEVVWSGAVPAVGSIWRLCRIAKQHRGCSQPLT
jgi:hypothetical protein